MNMVSWKTSLRNALKPPLPGLAAQEKMAPSERLKRYNPEEPSKAINSSVLILLYPSEQGLRIPFIQRPLYQGPHSGQISLPGGKCEKTDKNNWETALRETREELGICTDIVEYIGELTQIYIPNSHYYVSPQVGYIHKNLQFNPSPFEVSEVIEASAQQLLVQPYQIKKIHHIQGITIEAPFYDVNGKHIWGATAMILSELIEIIKTKAPYCANALRSCNAHTAQESL
jgi:8-oxo-dGTP pyrophosphatase MutT (NUDIX family)